MYADNITPQVQIALGYGPYDEVDPGDWTDISDYVLAVKTDRGRTSEFDQFSPGTMTVELNNDGRRFDPLYLDGPYAGLVPGTAFPTLQSSATKSGTSLGASNSMTMPSGITAGDLLLAAVVVDSTTDVTAAGSWLGANNNLPSSAGRAELFAKIAVGGDTLVLTGPTEDFACIVVRISGHNLSSGFTFADLGITTVGTGTSAIASGFSSFADPPPYENRLWLNIFMADDDDNSASPWATGYFLDEGNRFSMNEVALVESAQSTTSVMVGMSWVRGKHSGLHGFNQMAASEEWATYIAGIAPAPIPGSLLQPNTPIRLISEFGTHWQGVVDAWPMSYSEGGYRSEITISCTDAFKTLAERPLPDTFKDLIDEFGSPKAWYKMDKVIDSNRTPNSVPGGPDMYLLSKWQESAPISVASEGSLTSAYLPVGVPAYQAAQVSAGYSPSYRSIIYQTELTSPATLLEGINWTMSMTVQAERGLLPGKSFFLWTYFLSPWAPIDTGGAGSFIQVASPGHIYQVIVNPTASVGAQIFPNYALYGSTQFNLLDGGRHVVTLVREDSTLAIFVDGFLLGADVGLGVTEVPDDVLVGGTHQFMGAWAQNGLTTEELPPLAIDDVIFWSTNLNTPQIQELYEVLTTKEAPVLTGTAIEDLLDLIGWPASMRDIDAGTILMQKPANLLGQTALEYLQTIAATESGRLFISANGKVTFHDRSRQFSNVLETTAQYTFTSPGGVTDAGILDESLTWVLDDSFVYTAAEVTREGGEAQYAFIEDPPRRTWKLEKLLMVTDAQAMSLAEWIIFRYSVAQPRTEAWEVDPDNYPADWEALVGLEIGTKVLIDFAPGEIGDSLELEQHIEYIGHEILPGEEWIITLNGVPADFHEYFVWTTLQTTDEAHGWSQDGIPPGGAWA